MLICNNCFSENADGTVRCHHCNMGGNFSYKISEGNPQAFSIVKKSLHQCNNCGSDEPGEGLKCVHCHFPMANTQQQTTKTLAPREYNNLKTG